MEKGILPELNKILHYCKKSVFYQERIPNVPLTSLEDFKHLPLTTKEELRSASPFGMICIPHQELYQYHETFGTTGTPASSWFTRRDIQNIASIIASWGVNFSENDTVLVRFPYAISSAAHFVHVGAQFRQACVIPCSSRSTVSPFTRVIDLLKKLKVTVLAALPLQVLLIAETAEILGFAPQRDFPHLRAIATAGEPLPPAYRELLEKLWNVPVYDHYGMTECGPVALQCQFGRYHVPEEFFYIEILNPDTHREVEAGFYGDLVVTTLKREATPLLRYSTQDQARILDEPCPCGAKSHVEFRGRREDVIISGERKFDYWDLQQIVSHFPCHRFWVAGPSEKGIHLIIENEWKREFEVADLIADLEKSCNIPIRFEWVPKGTLYDRSELLSVGVVGKPKYIYTAAEMQEKKYLASDRV